MTCDTAQCNPSDPATDAPVEPVDDPNTFTVSQMLNFLDSRLKNEVKTRDICNVNIANLDKVLAALKPIV